MSLDQQFSQVSEAVRNWSQTPAEEENLALYSLYKQAVYGDVNIEEPSTPLEKRKFDAWTSRKGISKDEAKKQYIQMAEELKSKYA